MHTAIRKGFWNIFCHFRARCGWTERINGFKDDVNGVAAFVVQRDVLVIEGQLLTILAQAEIRGWKGERERERKSDITKTYKNHNDFLFWCT